MGEARSWVGLRVETRVVFGPGALDDIGAQAGARLEFLRHLVGQLGGNAS